MLTTRTETEKETKTPKNLTNCSTVQQQQQLQVHSLSTISRPRVLELNGRNSVGWQSSGPVVDVVIAWFPPPKPRAHLFLSLLRRHVAARPGETIALFMDGWMDGCSVLVGYPMESIIPRRPLSGLQRSREDVQSSCHGVFFFEWGGRFSQLSQTLPNEPTVPQGAFHSCGGGPSLAYVASLVSPLEDTVGSGNTTRQKLHAKQPPMQHGCSGVPCNTV